LDSVYHKLDEWRSEPVVIGRVSGFLAWCSSFLLPHRACLLDVDFFPPLLECTSSCVPFRGSRVLRIPTTASVSSFQHLIWAKAHVFMLSLAILPYNSHFLYILVWYVRFLQAVRSLGLKPMVQPMIPTQRLSIAWNSGLEICDGPFSFSQGIEHRALVARSQSSILAQASLLEVIPCRALFVVHPCSDP
jgi:hypothetical protein